METVLVTGGAGFIGSHLVPSLRGHGYAVRILDCLSPQVHGATQQVPEWIADCGAEIYRGSVVSREDLGRALAEVDYVIHLAAETGTGQSMYQIAHYNEINSQGTAILFDVLVNNKSHSVQRVVLASSRSVYGEGAYVCDCCGAGQRVYPSARRATQLILQRWEHECQVCAGPLRVVATAETDAVRPASIYAATKFAQEDLVRVGCEALGIEHVILRLQNVYGEGQSLCNPYTGILSIFSTRIRRGLCLPIFEDGLESRDFVHVSDVVNTMILGLTNEDAAGRVVNVGSGIATPVLDVARQLSFALRAEQRIEVTGEFRVGDIRHNFADIAVLREQLGYAPKVDLAEGLKRFAAWVSEQPLAEDLLEQANLELRQRKLMG